MGNPTLSLKGRWKPMPLRYARGLRKLLSKWCKTLVGPMTQIGDAGSGNKKMSLPPVRVQPAPTISLEEWMKHSTEIAAGLSDLLRDPVQGEAIRSLLDEQVGLITSLPLDAAKRVQELSLQVMSGAKPASSLMEEILRTGLVTINRATLIARTETARANAVLTQARSEMVGSPGYIWRTAHDDLVRHEHRRLDGKFFTWDDPPVAMANGTRAGPGETPNCRCWADPVMPGEETPTRRVKLRAS